MLQMRLQVGGHPPPTPIPKIRTLHTPTLPLNADTADESAGGGCRLHTIPPEAQTRNALVLTLDADTADEAQGGGRGIEPVVRVPLLTHLILTTSPTPNP